MNGSVLLRSLKSMGQRSSRLSKLDIRSSYLYGLCITLKRKRVKISTKHSPELYLILPIDFSSLTSRPLAKNAMRSKLQSRGCLTRPISKLTLTEMNLKLTILRITIPKIPVLRVYNKPRHTKNLQTLCAILNQFQVFHRVISTA